jgi:protein SCO1/2
MKRKGFWVTTGLLVVPVVIFYILNAGSQNFKTLPILGERIPPDGVSQMDTLYHTVTDFNGFDQKGKAFSKKDLNNSIYIANFFFASCKDVCPTMNRRLSKVYEKFKEFSEIEIVSFTVDPENDSFIVLDAYAGKFNADPAIWHFVKTTRDDLVKIGQSFLLPVSKEDKTIDHSQQFILVDKQKRIRGVYDSFSDADIKRLEEDIKVLLYEYHHPAK